ncbi:MAG TPA: alkaline phosphatase family protein [Candidatus Polarisedimenticolaceae bacterium]|nr:alkaline phosphatase family protein [Candidatus Polarisedimenticolaceae bacterium]
MQRLLAVLILLIGAAGPARAAPCRVADPEAPRVLVLALDGVPLRSIEAARAEGAFEGWPPPLPLVSSFPSVTNVAFTAILHPFGVDQAGGYEVAHFNRDKNKVVGGSPFGYEERLYAWRDAFDVTSRTFGSKLATYTTPKRASRHGLDRAEQALYELPDKQLILAHVGATDALIHLRGDKAILRFLIEVDERLREVKRAHRARTGRELSVVLLSDHGNSSIKIRKAGGLRKSLERAGLAVTKHIDQPGTVVAPTFGIVGYGALFMHRSDAATAGRAIVGNATVDLAAWLDEPSRMVVLSDAGAATVRWVEDGRGGLRMSYRMETGDPLEQAAALERLSRRGLLDAAGYATESAWFDETVASEYPDAMRRLIHSLVGTWVENYATVVFSLKPGYAWGWTSAHVSSKLSGGRLEGTHGGLDAASTIGFFMADDPARNPNGPVRADRALAGFAGYNDCLVVADDDAPGDHDPAVSGPR